jgi:hypothetical protein
MVDFKGDLLTHEAQYKGACFIFMLEDDWEEQVLPNSFPSIIFAADTFNGKNYRFTLPNYA